LPKRILRLKIIKIIINIKEIKNYLK